MDKMLQELHDVQSRIVELEHEANSLKKKMRDSFRYEKLSAAKAMGGTVESWLVTRNGESTFLSVRRCYLTGLITVLNSTPEMTDELVKIVLEL